jgi:hypothetical protein
VCEQYPSIPGDRHFVFGSTRVLVSIQSRVPGFAFSRAIRSLDSPAGALFAVHPGSAATVPAAKVVFNTSRRVGRWAMPGIMDEPKVCCK